MSVRLGPTLPRNSEWHSNTLRGPGLLALLRTERSDATRNKGHRSWLASNNYITRWSSPQTTAWPFSPPQSPVGPSGSCGHGVDLNASAPSEGLQTACRRAGLDSSLLQKHPGYEGIIKEPLTSTIYTHMRHMRQFGSSIFHLRSTSSNLSPGIEASRRAPGEVSLGPMRSGKIVRPCEFTCNKLSSTIFNEAADR